MAKDATGRDTADSLVTGSFSGTGQSGSFTIDGAQRTAGGKLPFNASLWGTFVATVQLERSFDGGTTWLPAAMDTAGTPAAYTSPISVVCGEPERNVLYRWNCTAYTSGTVNYRLSR